jgi:hypothetical protein
MKLDKILKSKTIYYVALVLMVINVLGYVSMGSVECVVIFAVTTYLTNHFTKNRSVDILAGLFVANVVFGCGRIKEGMEPLNQKLDKAIAEEETAVKQEKKSVKVLNALKTAASVVKTCVPLEKYKSNSTWGGAAPSPRGSPGSTSQGRCAYMTDEISKCASTTEWPNGSGGRCKVSTN